MQTNNPGTAPQKNNPYAAAAGTYDQHAQTHTPDQRELEGRILLKSAKGLQQLIDNWDKMTSENLDEVLNYNRQIWMMFVDTAMEDEDPDRTSELRNNIANLGLFIFNHTLDILSAPEKEKLDILIEINRDIAAGLMAKPKTGQEEKDDTAKTENESGSADTYS